MSFPWRPLKDVKWSKFNMLQAPPIKFIKPKREYSPHGNTGFLFIFKTDSLSTFISNFIFVSFIFPIITKVNGCNEVKLLLWSFCSVSVDLESRVRTATLHVLPYSLSWAPIQVFAMTWRTEHSFEWETSHRTFLLKGDPVSQDEIKCPDTGEDDGEERHMETYSFFSQLGLYKDLPCWFFSPLPHAAKEGWLFPAQWQCPRQQARRCILPKTAENHSPRFPVCTVSAAISIPPLPQNLAAFLASTRDVSSKTLTEKLSRGWDCNQKFLSFFLSHSLSTYCTFSPG